MLNFFKFRSAKPARPDVSAVVAKPASRRASLSSLMRDVLRPDGVPEQSHRTKAKIATQTASQKLNVGAELADAKRQIIETATKLSALVDTETAESLRTLVGEMEGHVCRIAIAGQMNAGKSSLINVLVEQSELLPADINPWTTVITRLHFGVHGKPTSGASFRFFTREEWRRLAAGGRTRELTEQLFPEFDWEELQKQLETMKKRAERKLGPQFETLLGAEQSYPTLTPGLLNRYVGAGQSDTSGGTQCTEGEFSDITKTADVFLDMGAFNFPTILIDTPGVNDPFLVRDEVTRQNLQSADLCVVVVTARQPLSNADLGLLRLLRSLNKNRLIIFLNKVDEIDGGEEVLNAISNRVSAILKQEFPSAHIPIVFGSAFWARHALGLSVQSRTNGRNKSGSLNGSERPGQTEIVGRLPGGALAKSGLLSLAVAISELMETGPVADAIENSKQLVDTIALNLIACLEAEIRLLSNGNQAKKEVWAFIFLKKALAVIFDNLAQALATIRSQQLMKLRAQLGAVVNARISEAASDPAQDRITFAYASQFDARLRVELENTFLNAFGEAVQSYAGALNSFISDARNLIEESDVIKGIAFSVGSSTTGYQPPSLAALGEPAAIELAASFGESLLEHLPQKVQGDYFSTVVAADFNLIVGRLADEAEGRLSRIAETVTQQISILAVRPLENTILRTTNALAAAESDKTRPALAFALEDARKKIAHLKQILRVEISESPQCTT
jgi:GTP-binding protein EngB required for normal cell division